jgi:hypothetical protein
MNFLRKHRRIIYVVGIVITVGIAAVLYVAAKHSPHRLFKRDGSVSIALNGAQVSDAGAYRSSQNVWLIDMGTGTEWYGYSDDHYLLKCQPPQRIPLPGSLYLLKDELPCVLFSDVKASNPRLVVTSNSIEFDSHEHRGRVRITF